METINVPIKEVKHVHSGQYHAYGDTFRECEIHTPDTLDEKDILYHYIIFTFLGIINY